MFKFKKPGIAIVEVLIVLAISGFMFASVIGVFNSRRSSAVDDAALQVVSEIAKVRNEAQENYLPQNVVDANSGKEFIGKYISFNGPSASQLNVGSVFKDNSTGAIYASTIVERTVTLSEGLVAYVYSNSTSINCDQFLSCYKPINSANSTFSASPIYVLYASGNALQSVFPAGGISGNGGGASDLRIAIAVPGSGDNLDSRMANAKKKYYINTPALSNPTLEVK